MEQNDIVTKNFESYADVAADIVNALLHGGNVVVSSEEMLTAATESLYADSRNTLHNQLEDVAKYHVIGGMARAMYLFANQTKVDKGMILRKAGYIGGEYRRQYEKQNHGLYPVIELVLYWGKIRWKASSNLRQLIENGDVAEAIWKYVDDMQLHVWEMRYLPQEIRERFHSDMRIILDYLAEGNAYRSNQKVIHKEATIKMIRVLSGDRNVNDTEEILKELDITEEDEISMCELFDQYTRRGRAEGRAEGREEGVRGIIKFCKELNISYQDAMNKICDVFRMSEHEAIEKLKLYW